MNQATFGLVEECQQSSRVKKQKVEPGVSSILIGGIDTKESCPRVSDH